MRGGAKLKTIIEEECPDEMRDHIFTNAKREVSHLITFTDAMPGPNANSGPALTLTVTLQPGHHLPPHQGLPAGEPAATTLTRTLTL